MVHYSSTKIVNILKALSTALGRGNTSTSEPTCTRAQHNTDDHIDQVDNVAYALNDRIHLQVKQLIDLYKSPEQHKSFNLESAMERMDPVLIELLTQSVRGKHHKKNVEEGTHVKKLRQFYSLCVILFCTNSQCSVPIHTILTEAVLCHWGIPRACKTTQPRWSYCCSRHSTAASY